MRTKTWLLGLAVSLSIVGLAACSGQGGESSSPESSAAAEQTPEASDQNGKPNTDDVPDVVAEVDGEKITKDDFVPLYEAQYKQMATQAQQSGQQVDEAQLKKQTAENLVGTKLLVHEADRRKITVSDKDIDKALADSAKSSQMSTKDFLAAMKEQGLDKEKVNSELGTQLKIKGLIKDEYGEFKVSDKEIKQAYEQAKAQQAQQGGQSAPVPALKKIRPQLKAQVQSQKANEATQKYVGKLRKKADVTINL